MSGHGKPVCKFRGGEHGEIWAGQRVKDEALQRQIDQVRREIMNLDMPRDTIQGILRRLDNLDRRCPPG